MKKKPSKYNYALRLHQLDDNRSGLVWYTEKGAELFDWLARRGYIALVWESGPAGGYYYKLEQLKEGLKTAWEEGLTKKGGYFYEEDPVCWMSKNSGFAV